MDWSQANHENFVRLGSRVHQWNTPQIWISQYHYNRSGIKLRLARILGLPRELLHWCQICVSRTSKSQRSSRTHQRIDNWWTKEKDLWVHKQKGGKWLAELPMVIWGLRTQPSKATGQTPFSSIWLQSNTVSRHHVEVTSSRDVWHNTSRWQSPIRVGLTRRDEMQCTTTINLILSKHVKISRSQHPDKIFQCQRHGPQQDPRRDRPPQTQLKMGRTFHRHQSHGTRILSTDLRGRTRSPQLLEHRASSEVLPISC